MRGAERVEQKAFKGFGIEDTTGAGDLFASGFMYGLLRNHSLQRCCEIGCLSGAAVVQVDPGTLTTTPGTLAPTPWNLNHHTLEP
jgi:sugar/nucleoside kinase (ribokinase family)